MSRSDFVSITIVTYNSGRFIKRCLESVLDQNYPLKEIIVIDNNSSDGTIDILEPFEDRCRIIYNEENIGFAAAQNQAIAAGDLGRAAGFWTEDVTVRRALGQPLSGRDAARQALAPPASPAVGLVYQRLTKDVEVSPKWPLAFETGTWEGHRGTIAGPVIIAGRYSAQWVKRGGRWLIRSEVFVALTCSGVGCESVAVP